MTFDEPVDVSGGWYDIKCPSGPHTAVVSGGPLTFTLDPVADFDIRRDLQVHGLPPERHRPGHERSARHRRSADHVATFQTVAAPPSRRPSMPADPTPSSKAGASSVSATGSQPDGDALDIPLGPRRQRHVRDGRPARSPSPRPASTAPSTQTIAVRATGPDRADRHGRGHGQRLSHRGRFSASTASGVSKNLPDGERLQSRDASSSWFSLGGNQGLDIFKNGSPDVSVVPVRQHAADRLPTSPRRLQGGKRFQVRRRVPTSTRSSGTSTSRGRAPAGCSSSGSATDPRTTWRSASVPLQQLAKDQ